MQPLDLAVREVGYRTSRIDSGPVQRLAGVYVPDSSHAGLVHQGILDGGATFPESVTECRPATLFYFETRGDRVAEGAEALAASAVLSPAYSEAAPLDKSREFSKDPFGSK